MKVRHTIVFQRLQLRALTEYGCYITKYGQPTRNCGFVRWEIKAKSFAFRDPYVLLFGDNFIEIRHAATGQFRQMIERKAIRLLDQTGLMGDTGEFMIAWKGEKNDDLGQSDALVEVIETRDLTVASEGSDVAALERSISAISAVSVTPAIDPLWDEWS
jgi:RHO1 GDP-GTP exchange protein 1/2